MLDKAHVATVFESGYARVLIYLDGSIVVSSLGESIALSTSKGESFRGEKRANVF